MFLKGHCAVQDCEFSIRIEEIPCPTFENPKAVIYGRIGCQYASRRGCCNGQCSILEQHGIKQG